jgi:4-carboxymuconolactone decarboxylase
MAILMAGRKWTVQYEFYAHRRLALETGLRPAIADAIAANHRPASMAKDEETVYDFVSELLADGQRLGPTFQRVKDTFGECGVVDLVGAVGYYSLVFDDAERRAGATARRSHAAPEVGRRRYR